MERIKKISQLGAGPQIWFFLKRNIAGSLADYEKLEKGNSEKVYGIYADEPVNTNIEALFKNDLQTLIRSNRPQIRPFFGDNGTGKSTHFQFFRQILEANYAKDTFFFDIDLRSIAEKSEKGLWLAIFNQIYSALHSRQEIIDLLHQYDERDLLKIFKSTDIAKNAKIFGQDAAEQYFYSKDFQNISNIQGFFNGLIDLFMDRKILTVIAVDEVQQIEKWGDPAFEAFLESFVSSTYDKYMRSEIDARLFFLLSFLLKHASTRDDKFRFLEKHSPGFVSRIRGREIVLCNFTDSEHHSALELIAEITNLSSAERVQFEKYTKQNIMYWATRNNPREFGKFIQKTFEDLEFLKLSPSEARQIYEKEARDCIQPKLVEKGFTSISDCPRETLGYQFDVYAEAQRRMIIEKFAFGEIKTTQRHALKGWVEKFAGWVKSIRESSVYNRSDNYYFFMSPFDPTPAVSEILQQYSIDWIQFRPPELIFEEEPEEPEKPPKPVKPAKRVKKPAILSRPLIKMGETTLLADSKIPGLGDKRLQTLTSQGIKTLKDLRDADLDAVSERSPGITLKMLLTWRTHCEKLLNP